MNSESDAKWTRKTFNLPAETAAWLDDHTGPREASAYVTSLIEAARYREHVDEALREYGYVGDMAPTDAGRARVRAALNRNAEARAARERAHKRDAA
jgi:hypothetical protein